MHAAIVVRGNSLKHGRCAVRALADERRTGKARHHVGPRIAGHAVRGGEHHAPDSSVGMTVPHGGQGHDPDAVRAAVAHERGDHFGVEPRRARRATSATCKLH